MPTSRAGAISTVATVAILLLLAVMLGRVVQLQLAPSAEILDHLSEHTSTTPIPGVRGDLLDRRGRPLALTRLGYRAVIDPVELTRNIPKSATDLPAEAGKLMAQVADLVGLPIEEVALRLAPALDKNERLQKDPAAPRDEAGRIKGLDRYVPLATTTGPGGTLEEWRVDAIRSSKLKGINLEPKGIRLTTGDALAASLVGLVGFDEQGSLGAEKWLDKRFRPEAGHLTYVRDSRGQPIWIEPGSYDAPQRGEDIRLAVDLELQRIVLEELKRGVEEADAAGGRAVMVDPATGEVLAIVDYIRPMGNLPAFPWAKAGDKTYHEVPIRRYQTIRSDAVAAQHPAQHRNRCVEDSYEPGSTFKPFMWSLATELSYSFPGEVIDTEDGVWNCYGNRVVHDEVRRPRMTWTEVLVNSSNIGMSKVVSRVPWEKTRDRLKKLGFGARTKLGLPGESTGLVTPMSAWSKYTQTSVAMGYEVGVTPVQMARAFCVFARTGEQAGTMPDLRLEAANLSPGAKGGRTPDNPVRVIKPEIAELTRKTMSGVTANVDNRFHEIDPTAKPPLYTWFGKSGTAKIPLGNPPSKDFAKPRGSTGYYPQQYNSSFIAAAPADKPRIIVLVVMDDPGPAQIAARKYFGSWVAGPVVRRVIERSLPYLGVEPTNPDAMPNTARAQANLVEPADDNPEYAGVEIHTAAHGE